MSDAEAGSGPTPPSYAAAVAELDEILAELESPEVDVDVLAAKVERAAELVRWTRDRITAAKAEVDRVLAESALDET